MGTQISTNLAKYNSKNPFKRWLLNRFLDKITVLILPTSAKTILDVGCGEGLVVGNLLSRRDKLAPSVKITGVDVNMQALRQAKQALPAANFLEMDASNLIFKDKSFDLVILLEVLEHLSDPALAISEARRVSRKWCIFSVPNEPWFSLLSFLAGMYWGRLGKHPEHVNFWSPETFLKLINPYFQKTRLITSLPWTIVVAEV